MGRTLWCCKLMWTVFERISAKFQSHFNHAWRSWSEETLTCIYIFYYKPSNIFSARAIGPGASHDRTSKSMNQFFYNIAQQVERQSKIYFCDDCCQLKIRIFLATIKATPFMSWFRIFSTFQETGFDVVWKNFIDKLTMDTLDK